jgi:hypothetical protein
VWQHEKQHDDRMSRREQWHEKEKQEERKFEDVKPFKVDKL